MLLNTVCKMGLSKLSSIFDSMLVPKSFHFASKNPPKSYLGGVLGHLGGILEALGGILGPLEGLLGHLRAVLKASSGVLRLLEAL